MNIQPIVEGQGDVAAVPVLLRRLRDFAEVFEIDVNSPYRLPRNQFVDEARLRKLIRRAKTDEGCGAILLLCDSDDDCPKEMAPQIQQWARAEAGTLPCEVVMAKREYEAWFIATIESLRGVRGIREDATSHPDPETPRNAKGQLEERMGKNASYFEKADQPALSAVFNLPLAHARCRSFRRMVKAFGSLAEGMGHPIAVWPPEDWEGGTTL
jgi:hypothetical protein